MKNYTGLLISLSLVISSPGLIQAKWEDDEANFKDVIEAVGTITKGDKESKAPDTTPERKEELAKERGEQLDRIDNVADKLPNDKKVQRKVTESFLQVDEPGRALPRAEQLVRLSPKDPEALRLRGQTHYKLGDYRSAEADARKSLAIDPNNAQAFTLLKLTEGRVGPIGRARGSDKPKEEPKAPSKGNLSVIDTLPMPDFSGAIRTANGIKVGKFLKRAEQLSLIGDDRSALKLLEKALELDPKETMGHVMASRAKLGLGDAEAAKKYAEQALTLNPKSASGHQALGLAKEALGASDEEILSLFEKAAALDPRLTEFYQKAIRRLAANASSPSTSPLGKGYSSRSRASEIHFDIPGVGKVPRSRALVAVGLGLMLLVGIGMMFRRSHRSRRSKAG